MAFCNDTFDNISFTTSGTCRNFQADIDDITLKYQKNLIIENAGKHSNSTKKHDTNLSSDNSLFFDDSLNEKNSIKEEVLSEDLFDCDNDNEPLIATPKFSSEMKIGSNSSRTIIENDNCKKEESRQCINLEFSILRACEKAFNNIKNHQASTSGIAFDDTLFLNESLALSQKLVAVKNENVLSERLSEDIAEVKNELDFDSQISQESVKKEIELTEESFHSCQELTGCSENKLEYSQNQYENLNVQTIKTVTTKEDCISQICNLSSWGLPNSILQKYAAQNVTTMFSWQVECLNNSNVLKTNSNLVYSAPTSAGKTLVAEILTIKTVLERKKKVLFILPFVSVVREKMFYFQNIFGSSGVRVEGFMGSHNPPGGFPAVHVAICTIEKANGIVNRLLEEGKLDDVGAVIIDEMHLIGDPSRGYLLELLLTKLKYMLQKSDHLNIQIVGMSATLPNLNILAKWLDAELFTTDFRPIPLHEQCMCNGEIYNNSMKLERKLELLPELETDTDNILQLCIETLKESCSVLIFCPTKNWCESLALQIASAFWKLGSSDSNLGLILREQLNSNAIAELLQQLKRCPVGLDQVLSKTVSFGVSFHHAGLTMDERDIIEMSFKSGTLRVLVATSTLSSGVNLPAKRVIMRTPLFHGKPIDSLTYRQMIGRAGRMGRDTSGESILICHKNDYYIAKELMSANLNPIESCLEGAGKLKRALLEIIASGVANTPEDINLFANSTLLAACKEVSENPIEEALDFLTRNEFIRLHQTEGDDACQYKPTSLGKACLSSSMPPEEGLALFSELEKARQCFVLENELHVIYLVTPYSACNQWTNVDWMLYLSIWERLPASMKRVGELVGVRDSYLISGTRGKVQTNTSKLYHKFLVHKRFFVALALQDLVNEIPLNEVAAKFNCNRGMLQSLQQSASTFAGMLTVFSRQLGWSSIEILVAQFQDRLQFGVNRDLLDLMRLPLLNGPRARSLFNNGIESLVQLAAANVVDIETILLKSAPFESDKEREGESKFDVQKRKKMRSVWITGKEGVTETEAAEMLIRDAREYLRLEMGLIDAKWEDGEDNEVSTPIKTKSAMDKTDLNENPTATASNQSNPTPTTSNKSDIISDQSLFEDSRENQNVATGSDSGLDFGNNSVLENAFVTNDDCDIFVSQEVRPGKRNLSDSQSSFIEQTPTKKKKITKKKSSRKLAEFNQLPNVCISQDKMKTELENDLWFNTDNESLPAANFDKIEIVEVCRKQELFETFQKEFMEQNSISLSVACVKYLINEPIIGVNMERRAIVAKPNFVHKDRQVEGIVVSWGGNVSYYLDFTSNFIPHSSIISLLKKVLQQSHLHVRMFDAKEQIKVLKQCCGINVSCSIEDPKIGDWLLQPDEKEKTLQAMVVNYLPEAMGLSQLTGNCKGTGSVGLDLYSTVESKLRGGIEAVVGWHLTEVVKCAVSNYNLLDTYDIEMKCILCLAKMELKGLGLDVQKLQELCDNIRTQTSNLEQQAFSLAGRRFSFTSTTEVAKILRLYRKPGRRVSTSKQCLMQQTNPIASLILQWRKLNSTLTKMIYPLIRMVQNGRIYGCSISHNSTGRISMHEPNLQNVPKDFEVKDPITECVTNISCRMAFVAQQGCTLLSADYSQLELRLLAHFSQDPILCRIMRHKGDVFKSIAAKWHNVEESQVEDKQRQWAKQICYGIIYGMGKKALAEQLGTTEDEAGEFIESFHNKYPSIQKYIKETISKCLDLGYVTTLAGRRRYLPNISHGNSTIRSQTERQAVNTTIQGSAADIAKTAMVLIENEFHKTFLKETNHPRLVLHLHDELLYEVSSKYLLKSAKSIKKSMEKAVKLSVPFPVKLKSGNAWGEMSVLLL